MKKKELQIEIMETKVATNPDVSIAVGPCSEGESNENEEEGLLDDISTGLNTSTDLGTAASTFTGLNAFTDHVTASSEDINDDSLSPVVYDEDGDNSGDAPCPCF